MFETPQKKFGITCVYKKTTTLGQLLFQRRPKKDKWNTSHIGYSVPCSNPPHQYISQTKRKTFSCVSIILQVKGSIIVGTHPELPLLVIPPIARALLFFGNRCEFCMCTCIVCVSCVLFTTCVSIFSALGLAKAKSKMSPNSIH